MKSLYFLLLSVPTDSQVSDPVLTRVTTPIKVFIRMHPMKALRVGSTSFPTDTYGSFSLTEQRVDGLNMIRHGLRVLKFVHQSSRSVGQPSPSKSKHDAGVERGEQEATRSCSRGCPPGCAAVQADAQRSRNHLTIRAKCARDRWLVESEVRRVARDRRVSCSGRAKVV